VIRFKPHEKRQTFLLTWAGENSVQAPSLGDPEVFALSELHDSRCSRIKSPVLIILGKISYRIWQLD